MRALLVDRSAKSGVRLVEDYSDPSPGVGEVRIAVRCAGVCSTDLEIAKGYMQFDGVLGHEFVGTVETGDERLAGQRVVAEINCVGPGSGLDPDDRKHAMPRTVLGIAGRDGAFADYVCVPAENCHVVPESVSDDEAVFVEPLAAAVQVIEDHPVTADTRVAVLGTGRLGVLCAQVLALHTERLDVIGRNPQTVAFCRELGLNATTLEALSHAAAYDFIVECTGAPAGLRLALERVRPRGTVVLKSTYAQPPDVDLAPIVINEIRVAGNRCGPFADALELLVQRRVRVREMISARFPLSHAVQAFAEAGRPGRLKVLVEPGAA